MELLALNQETLSAIFAVLAWIGSAVTAIVVLAWRISAKVQRHLDHVSGLEKTAINHEKRIRRLEKVGNLLHFSRE